MAKLRQASAYRRVKRPYTRTSRVRSKAYIKGVPNIRIVHYDMGEKGAKFPYEVQIVSDKAVQVRDNALEATRQVLVRTLEKISKGGWAIKIRAVPHHILRLHPLATGAGADRFQRGMTLAYGRPEGHAAQVYKGKILFSIYVSEEKLKLAKTAANKAKAKLPMPCKVRVLKIT